MDARGAWLYVWFEAVLALTGNGVIGWLVWRDWHVGPPGYGRAARRRRWARRGPDSESATV